MEKSKPERSYRDQLLEQVALCLVGVLRERYMANQRALESAPIVTEHFRPINEDIMDRMSLIIALLGQIQGEAIGDLPSVAEMKFLAPGSMWQSTQPIVRCVLASQES